MNNRFNMGEAALGSPQAMISLVLDASQIPRGLDGPAVAALCHGVHCRGTIPLYYVQASDRRVWFEPWPIAQAQQRSQTGNGFRLVTGMGQ
jgi:hypothetical protein